MQVGTHRQYIMPHTGELPPNLANSLRQAQTALTVAKGWAEKHYGPRLHPNTFTILSSLTYDPAALNDIHGSESHRDSPAADAVTRPSTEVELDVRDESQFPKLSRPTAPPTRSLYMGSRPTLTEQYPQIRNKSTPISHIAPKPEQPAICNTERWVTSSTPLPPRHTGPIKGNRTGANCPSIHTPNSSLISSDPPTLPGAGRLAGIGPGTPIPPLPLSPPSVLPSPHNCSHLSDLSSHPRLPHRQSHHHREHHSHGLEKPETISDALHHREVPRYRRYPRRPVRALTYTRQPPHTHYPLILLLLCR